MIVTCYFADSGNAYPVGTTALYDQIWPIMHQSVRAHGYDLIHLTSEQDEARTRYTFRAKIDPKLVVYSREVAWLAYLRYVAPVIEDDEQIVMIEPDAFLVSWIPKLAEGKDLMLLRRPGDSLSAGFRLCTKRAIPFYEAIVEEMAPYSDAHKLVHGDGIAHHKVVGVEHATDLPDEVCGVKTEIRSHGLYCQKDPNKKGVVALNFKGLSKPMMLKMGGRR